MSENAENNNDATLDEAIPQVELADLEADHSTPGDVQYDPFASRQAEHLTTDFEALVHVLKAAVCTGILGMPLAFQKAGIVVAFLSTIVISALCAHTAAILVRSAHSLYYRVQVPSMTFAQVAEAAFLKGPERAKKYSETARLSILIGLFATYFGTCSVYVVIIAYNIQQVTEYFAGKHVDSRVYIAALFIPLVLVSWVPNLKRMAKLSLLANLLMAVGLCITMYYLLVDLSPISERQLFAHVSGFPVFMGITIFAVQAIGVIMPLENSMKTPQNFLGPTGVLSKGMIGVTAIYILLGFLGYLKYGYAVEGSITLNLPAEEIPVQIVAVAIGLGIFFTYGLQYFVFLEIAWDAIKHRFPNKPFIAEYTLRTILVMLTVLAAIVVPTIGAFMGLIGALCFSTLGIIVPPVIQVMTFWDEGFGYAYYRLWKNIIIVVLGIVAMLTGTYTSILEIIASYKEGF